MTPREGALECCARGWYVFRLIVTHDPRKCDGGTASCKSIRTPNGEPWSEIRSADPDVVAGWDWDGVNAYGIACGPSRLLVVDRDPRATWPFGGTRIHATGRGEHYLYRDEVGWRVGLAGVEPWGVDIKGDGGMIIGPGSWHPHGEYRVEADVEPGPIPPEMAEYLAEYVANRVPAEPDEVTELDQLEVLPRLEGVYRALAAAEPGSINIILTGQAAAAAGLWARLPEDQRVGEFDAETIVERLVEIVESIPHPYGEAQTRATIERQFEWGAENPLPDSEMPGIGERGLSGIWDETPILDHIRTAAHARGLKAPLVLAYVLAYVLVEIPPGWVLPPVVATRAPLNLGFAVVGRSSAGKSASASVAAEVLGLDPARVASYTRPIGSGEGMIDQFLDYSNKTNGEPTVIADPRRLFSADEVETLNRLVERSGQTLGSFLKTALMGANLGTANAKADGRSRNVPGGAYRLVMVVGVQPPMAGVLLSGENSGLPQRFLWMGSADVDTPRTIAEIPEWPGPVEWEPPTEALFTDHREITYPETIQDEVAQANLDEQHRDDGELSEGHLNLTRLKVAMALAYLHGEADISERWWALAGRFTRRSMGVIEWCEEEIAKEAKVAEAKRAEKAGEAAVITNRVVTENRAVVSGAIRAIGRVAKEAGDEGVPWSSCRRAMSKKQKEVAIAARVEMEASGLIEVQEMPVGSRGGRSGEKVVWIGGGEMT